LACRLRPRSTTRQAAPAVATLPRAPRELRRSLVLNVLGGSTPSAARDPSSPRLRRARRPPVGRPIRRGKPRTRFPLCPRFKLPVAMPPLRDGPAILSFKRGHSLHSPKAVTPRAKPATWRASPAGALRAKSEPLQSPRRRRRRGPDRPEGRKPAVAATDGKNNAPRSPMTRDHKTARVKTWRKIAGRKRYLPPGGPPICQTEQPERFSLPTSGTLLFPGRGDRAALHPDRQTVTFFFSRRRWWGG
jgi:hypothetical protein